MQICFFNMNHIGDVYFSSFFLRALCRLNLNEHFYFFSILGDVFFENITNIKRLGKIDDTYKENLINGNPPENLINSDILQILLQNNMHSAAAKVIKIVDQDILFINTWCTTDYLRHVDFDIVSAMNSYANLIKELEKNYNITLNFRLDDAKELLQDISYQNENFLGKYSNVDLSETEFVFNYVPRSMNFNMGELNNYILKLSETKPVILACYNSIFDNNPNIKFIDRDYNLIATPSCNNLIELWDIAIQCKKIIILPSGGSWTFFHKLNEIKDDQIFMFNGHHYTPIVNCNINILLGQDKNFIKNL